MERDEMQSEGRERMQADARAFALKTREWENVAGEKG